MFTKFWDMHSGGGLKEEPYDQIIIEAESEGQAKVIFYNRFGHSPDRVSCTCCGEDYSIYSNEDLAQLTGFHRNCDYDNEAERYVDGGDGRYGRPNVSVEDWLAGKGTETVLFIRAEDVTDDEREGDVPEQGYVWMD